MLTPNAQVPEGLPSRLSHCGTHPNPPASPLLVTTSRALVTTSVAPVPSSFSPPPPVLEPNLQHFHSLSLSRSVRS